ncbi:hypothetical protein KGP36_04750 [Patescibacteria group bacterium]|nr:hypothetical protein [Patescibacteria group bacterium]MDE1941273.1 hypothetical protein [Patescibacteria group bacterium]
MKNPTALALLLALPLAGIPALGAQLQISIIPTVGCGQDSPDLDQNETNIMAGLQNLTRVADWTTAPSWRPFAYLKWPTLVSSTNSSFALWMGSPDPAVDYGSGFANEMGNRLDWCITVFSTNGEPWEAKDLYYSIACSYPDAIPPSSGSLAAFSPTAIGVNYDQFGDPIVYTNGEPATTQIQDLYYIGPQTALSVGDQSSLTAARTALTKPGFTITLTVWHRSATGTNDAESSLTLFTAPEILTQKVPSGLACLLSGQPNLLYRIQRSPDLAPESWTTIRSQMLEGSWFTNGFLGSRSFFRAVTP